MTTDLSWRLARYDELTVDELYRILALRQEVFVVEQACPYQDVDGRDRDATHLWTDDADGVRVLGYARLFAPGVCYAEACIGRVVTAPSTRRSGLGRALMHEAIARLHAAHGPVAIRISAQRYLERFYGELGFVPASAEYDEDGIPHIAMVRP